MTDITIPTGPTEGDLLILGGDVREFRNGRWEQEIRGQGLVEYALILALIAVVAIVALSFLGLNISEILSRIGVGIGG